MRWQITAILPNPYQVLEVDLPLSDPNLINFAALGIYATDALVNSSSSEYLSTLTMTTDERNETEVYCRARLNFGTTVGVGPATIILFGECAGVQYK